MKKEFVKGDELKINATVEKVKKGLPTVLIINGRRYVYDPKKINRVGD